MLSNLIAGLVLPWVDSVFCVDRLQPEPGPLTDQTTLDWIAASAHQTVGH